ncbi:MAG: glycoside hydrolase family 9 protein [Lachnospiraceae bacterium]|nr:glycoside hydrolase family 9 protein [Lachnospiraceae bacterium]
MRYKACISIIIILLMVAGCGMIGMYGTAGEASQTTAHAAIATLGLTPVFEYEYTEQCPAITTDRVGYIPTGKKVIYIEGTDPVREFCIINTDNDSVVYEGHLHRVSDDKNSDGKNTVNTSSAVYIGDFSEFTSEGSYRAFQPDVGYSYEFEISPDNYHAMYMEAYKTVTDAEYIQTSALIYTLGNLMLTKEIYGNAYCGDAFIKGGIEVLMAQQHPRTGAVYQDLQTPDTLALIEEELKSPATATIQTDSMISLSATAELAGVLAQYYCNYIDVDQVSAQTALRAAAKAYNYVDRFRDGVSSDSLYFAASELYRATGQYRYKKSIADYDLIPEQTRIYSGYDYTMLADVAYLSSQYKTDYVRCEELMGRYRELASDISKSSGKQSYYVQSDIDKIGEGELLHNMMTLGLVSYVLSGREYASIQSNYLHYLFGINKDMTNYYTDPMAEGALPLNTDIINLTKLIFILASRE